MNQSERDTLADLKKVFETEFWTDVSDDEGIGSDDSMENGNTNDKEYQIQRSSQEDSDKNAIKNKIKRSKSLVAINQLRTRIIDGISRKFHDEPVVIRETVSYGEAGKSKIDVFGLDLSEMCIKTGTEVPEIVTFCIQKIEKLGVTDGIYRISGIYEKDYKIILIVYNNPLNLSKSNHLCVCYVNFQANLQGWNL